MAAACLLIVAGSVLKPAPLIAAEPPRATVFERADFVLSKSTRPPDDTAEWQPVSLPHEWRHTSHGKKGPGWYRIQFDLPQVPDRSRAISLLHLRSQGFEIHVNGTYVGRSSDYIASSGRFGTAIYLNAPPSLFRAGDNVIHFRMNANSESIAMHGLGQVAFGNARDIRRLTVMANELGFAVHRSILAMAFTAGLITLFLWLARRSDNVMLWYSITCLSWFLVSLLRHVLRWSDLPLLNGMLTTYMTYGLVPPAVILCLRTAGLRWPRFEAVLWAFLIVEVTYPLWLAGEGNLWALLAWDTINTIVLLTGVAIMLVAPKRTLKWPYILQVTALLLMAVLMFHEVMRYLGWVDIESYVIRHFHVPWMLLAIGAAIFERHVVAVWRMQRSNLELERRVAEKAREIEANHARVEEAAREQTLARERSRILADMHDGLGASLVALLRYVQSERLDAHVEQRVKEALQELRISIDALEPSAGDVGAVLGNLRYRLEPLLQPSGVQIEWEVAELPQIRALEPTAVFALQRIVLEAVANALKHSRATRVRLSAQAAANGGVEIRIEDDGRGFDPSQPATGLGLTNMRARAARIGVQLEISSRTGSGTMVRLLIPRLLPVLAEDKASGKLDPRTLHGLVPTTGVA
ncbi:MAG: ATP-binding protein [Burkholderiales bacterium]